MKRKKIEAVKPIKPRTEKKIATIQELGDILILNIWSQRELYCRYCINVYSGEHEYWEVKEGWKKGKLLTTLGENPWHWSWMSYGGYPELSDEDKKRLCKLTGASEKNPYRGIEQLEKEYDAELRWKTEENRKDRLKDFMGRVPDISQNFREWFFEVAAGEEYMFKEKGTREFQCTNCGEKWKEKEIQPKIRHNDMVICPGCGKKVLAKTRTKRVTKKGLSAYVLQEVDETASVLRIFDVEIGWDNGRHYVSIDEQIRVVMYKLSMLRKNRHTYKIYYAYWNGWEKANYKKYRAHDGYLYPGEFKGVLEDTIYSGASYVLEYLSKRRQKLNYNRLLSGEGNVKRYAQKVELLSKGRFWKLLRETVSQTEYHGYTACYYYGPLNIRADSLEEFFRIKDKQKINRIRDENGGNDMVYWMQYSDRTGQKIPRDTLQWLIREEIEPEQAEEIKKYMNPQQIMNYIKRQQKEQYPAFTAAAVMEEYLDYIAMCEACDKNMKDEMVYRPRELKRRHDEIVIDKQQIEILRAMENNQDAQETFAQEMRDKYPTAEQTLSKIRNRYEYENEEYKIIVPKTLVDIVKEGRVLHHCAGSSERYFNRIEAEETYICFLRRKEAPGIPFYTIEVEPGGTIRQHRSYLDEEPGIDQIRAFLKEWQKVIKKRLTERDRELARMSKEKREANIRELQEKNNTRVLQGLAEDFMDAEFEEAV